MIDTPWTPGPWVWQAEEECLVGPHFVVMRQDDEGRKVFADYPDGTTQANACLIAAAPDMAEALRLFLEYDGTDTDDVRTMLAYADALSAAKAAYAKARGAS